MASYYFVFGGRGRCPCQGQCLGAHFEEVLSQCTFTLCLHCTCALDKLPPPFVSQMFFLPSQVFVELSPVLCIEGSIIDLWFSS